jgi:rhodanese-related sulfurtransferase
MYQHNHYAAFTVSGFLLCLVLSSPAFTDSGSEVNITVNLPYVEVIHKGKKIRIKRNQDTTSIVDLDYALTSRPCPPYCIQPIKLAASVETIGELEMLNYLQKASHDDSILVIDSREPKWLQSGMIPGAINLPWNKLYNKTASDEEIADILQFQFNAVLTGKLWNFEGAKTLVFYCNGPWCGQSPTNIRALLSIGYPPQRIKWYRGGIQSWKLFGLTTVKP